MTNKNVGLKLLITITFIVMIIVNALANILPFNGVSTGEVSDSYPNLFAPAGITFSIWGLIYALLALHTLYQLGLFRGKEKANNTLLGKIGIIFSLTSLANSAWIFSWHYKIIPLSIILIVIILAGLIYIANILSTQNLKLREKLMIRLPFSVYLGWITVATIANATTLLVSIGWDGFGISESTWTIIVVTLGMIIGTSTTIRLKDIAYGLVLIWAYAGILYKHLIASGFSGQFPGIIISVSICILLFIIVNIYILQKRKLATR